MFSNTKSTADTVITAQLLSPQEATQLLQGLQYDATQPLSEIILKKQIEICQLKPLNTFAEFDTLNTYFNTHNQSPQAIAEKIDNPQVQT